MQTRCGQQPGGLRAAEFFNHIAEAVAKVCQPALQRAFRHAQQFGQGLSFKAIGRATDLDQRTVSNFLRAGEYPERSPRGSGPTLLDAYRHRVNQRFALLGLHVLPVHQHVCFNSRGRGGAGRPSGAQGQVLLRVLDELAANGALQVDLRVVGDLEQVLQDVSDLVGDLRALVPDVADVWIFHGPNQKVGDGRFGSFGLRATPVKIARSGKNALDFHLSGANASCRVSPWARAAEEWFAVLRSSVT